MSYSYITRALLGLTSPTNFRYDGSFAGSVYSESSATASLIYNIGQPAHIFLRSSTTAITDLTLPGVVGSAGIPVDGLQYWVRNTQPKGSSAGAIYSINVIVSSSGGARTIVTLYEEEAAHIIYNGAESEWYVLSHLTAW